MPKEQPECAYCASFAKYRYSMKGYPVFQCLNCGTGFVHPMPNASELARQYDGFLPSLNVNDYYHQRSSARRFFCDLRLEANGKLKMLDVGGGGGFYSKAFVDLGFGEAEYVDLDPVSCAFAEAQLGISEVHHAEAVQWAKQNQTRFDLIYCRHVLEHLANPTELLQALVKILTPTGKLVIACPNAESKEYLAYLRSRLRQRLRSIDTNTMWRRLSIIRKLAGGAFLHGIDPPRHVWALTSRGISAWAQKRGVSCETFTRHLGDLAFSPQYLRPREPLGKLEDWLGQNCFARIGGGTHLVAVIQNMHGPLR